MHSLSILNGCNFSAEDEAAFFADVEQQYMLLQAKIPSALSAEKSFFTEGGRLQTVSSFL